MFFLASYAAWIETEIMIEQWSGKNHSQTLHFLKKCRNAFKNTIGKIQAQKVYMSVVYMSVKLLIDFFSSYVFTGIGYR